MATEEFYRSVAGIAVIRNPTSQESEIEDDSNVKSLKRKLNEKLYLLVKKPRDDHAWQFPQGGIKQKKKESVSQGALRELSEECGSDIKVKLIDKEEAFCVYQYRFPDDFINQKAKKKNYIGAKVRLCIFPHDFKTENNLFPYIYFQVQFVRSEWISGQCQPDGKEIIDFAWLTKEEVYSYVSTEYGNGIKPIFD